MTQRAIPSFSGLTVYRAKARGPSSARAWLVFPAAALGLCILAWMDAVAAPPSQIHQVLFAMMLVGPGIFLFRGSPTYLVDLFLATVVVNREIRRLLDWGANHYSTLPVLSITPLLITGLMLLYVGLRWRSLPGSARRGGVMIAVAFLAALLIGLRYGTAAIYELGDYATPIIVLLFAIACRPSLATVRRWMLALLALGTMAAIYGIIQWATVPPWDAAWLEWSGMWSSMGAPIPYRMSIASTLESRGPAAMFFATVAAVAVGIPSFRRRAGIPVAVLCTFTVLLTQARTALIFLVVTLAATASLQLRKGGLKLLLLLIVAGFVGSYALSLSPESQRLSARVATLEDLKHDGSANGRVEIAEYGIGTVLAHPAGLGLGSGGNGTRLDSTTAGGAVGDDGYLELLSTLGVVQTLLFFGGLFIVVRPALALPGRGASSDPYALLGTAMCFMLIPSLAVGNMLAGAHASYMWLLLACGANEAMVQTKHNSPLKQRIPSVSGDPDFISHASRNRNS